MIDLRINNVSLDLPQGFTFSITRTSNLFEFETWQGDISTSFSLPASSQNKALLNNPQVIGASYFFDYVSCNIFYAGALLYTGSLVITKADENVFECHFIVGLGEFARLTKDKQLKGDYYGGTKTVDPNQIYYNSDVDEWALFPTWNESFDNSEALGFYNFLQNFRSSDALRFLNGSDDVLIGSDLFKYAITPFPYVATVSEGIFKSFGFNVQENYIRQDAELKTLCMYNNFDIHNFTLQYSSDTRNLSTSRRATTTATAITAFQSIRDRNATTFTLQECLPDVSIHKFLFAIASTFNIAYVFDDWRNVRILRRQNIIADKNFENITRFVNKDSIKIDYYEGTEGFHIVHKPSEADQDAQDFIDIEEFIHLWIQNIFTATQLSGITNPLDSEVVFSTTEDWFYQYQNNIENVSGVRRQRAFYEGIARGFHTSYVNGSITQGTYIDDRWGTAQFREDFVNNILNLFTINTNTSTFLNSEFHFGPDEFVTRTEFFGAERSNTKSTPLTDILLMMHRDNTVNGQLVNTGYVDIYDENNAAIPGLSFALRIDQLEGIYKKFFADYLYWFLEGKKDVEASALFDLSTIKKIDFTKKYRIGDINYFITQVNLSFSDKGIGISNLEMYTAEPSYR